MRLYLNHPSVFHRIHVSPKAAICGYCSKERRQASTITASVCTENGRTNRTFNCCYPRWISSFILCSSSWCCFTNTSTNRFDVSASGFEARMEGQWLCTSIPTRFSIVATSSGKQPFIIYYSTLFNNST